MMLHHKLSHTVVGALLCGASAFGQYVPSGSNPANCDDMLEIAEHKFNFASSTLAGDSPFEPVPTCDGALLKHVSDPSRLTVKKKCVTVTGTVVDTAAGRMQEKHGTRRETEGDTFGWLRLDPGQEKF